MNNYTPRMHFILGVVVTNHLDGDIDISVIVKEVEAVVFSLPYVLFELIGPRASLNSMYRGYF